MALLVTPEIVVSHVNDASFVNVARCDVSGGEEIPKPLGNERIIFVVIRAHAPFAFAASRPWEASI